MYKLVFLYQYLNTLAPSLSVQSRPTGFIYSAVQKDADSFHFFVRYLPFETLQISLPCLLAALDTRTYDKTWAYGNTDAWHFDRCNDFTFCINSNITQEKERYVHRVTSQVLQKLNTFLNWPSSVQKVKSRLWEEFVDETWHVSGFVERLGWFQCSSDK